MSAQAPLGGFGSAQSLLLDLLRKHYPFLILGVLVIVASIASPAFLTTNNLRNLFSQLAVIGLVVLAELLVVITGGIDISVGSVLALSACLSAGLFSGSNVWVAALTAAVVGTFMGAVNGTLIGFRGIEPFIATLGMMALARGLTFAYSQGSPVIPTDPNFAIPGTSRIAGIPTIGFFWVAAIIIIAFTLNKTVFGRRLYAIGSSKHAATGAGVPVNRTVFFVYTLAGLMVGIAGFLLTSRVNAGTALAGNGYELDAIAAVVIGGARLSGGSGKAVGAVVGTIIFGVISNLLVLLNVSTFLQEAFKGALILVAVVMAAGKRGGMAAR
ncbi:MAG: ABC transporter permease [Propionibacteriaceae bacterium]|jgi:ribose/xylose/arabinose/galactoside ABC-type transport system permease subunit|nr:ABC transporter permease [Propionibacteriaceae bacterium]